MKLYHGSNVYIIDELKPHLPFARRNYTPRICFGETYITALAYCINPVRSYAENIGRIADTIPAFSCHCRLTENPPKIYELYDGMFEELFNKPCYIYECEVDESKIITSRNGFEKYVEEPVKIDNVIVIDNYLDELKKHESLKKIVLVSYNSSTINTLYDDLENKAVAVNTEVEKDFIENKCKNFCINIENCKRKYQQ